MRRAGLQPRPLKDRGSLLLGFVFLVITADFEADQLLWRDKNRAEESTLTTSERLAMLEVVA